MKQPKIDNSGVEAAQQAIADAQEAANNLRKNFQADLRTENLTQVAPGAGAEVGTVPGAPSPTRRRRSGGLSSQLGINV